MLGFKVEAVPLESVTPSLPVSVEYVHAGGKLSARGDAIALRCGASSPRHPVGYKSTPLHSKPRFRDTVGKTSMVVFLFPNSWFS